MENTKSPSVAETFRGKTVLLTGATGFLGKLTLEKLLRTCPKIKKIYIIVRTKKGKDQNQRRNEVFESEVFEFLRKRTAEKFEEKVEAISGDLTVQNLGISPADQRKLFDETNFVLHLAATVRFDEKIKTAVSINIKGTRDILRLAKNMKRLEGLVHVSTAYTFCPLQEIDEKFYQSPYDVDKMIKIADSLDDDLLHYITPKLLKDWPNTYVFTKAIAEHLIKTESDGLPLRIVRPSIVASTYREPFPGWYGNLYGAVGLMSGAALGLMKTMLMKPYKIADIVPADFVVNCVISAAWDLSNNRDTEPGTYSQHKSAKPKIYNYVSGPENPIIWEKICWYTRQLGNTIPSTAILWYIFFIPAPTEQSYKIYKFLFHLLPAYILDFFAKRVGRKPGLMKFYNKMHKLSRVHHYFVTRQWKFGNENTKNLWKNMNAEDRAVFPFSMKELSWDEYFRICIRGIRVYVFNDPMNTLEKGRAHYRRLKIYHYFVILIFIALLLAFVQKFLKAVSNILF